jgi:hypothetical protein
LHSHLREEKDGKKLRRESSADGFSD